MKYEVKDQENGIETVAVNEFKRLNDLEIRRRDRPCMYCLREKERL